MNTQLQKVLTILAGCHDGATHDALLLNTCDAQALQTLREGGFIKAHIQRHANPPGLVVTRYWIADRGLDVLNADEIEHLKTQARAANKARESAKLRGILARLETVWHDDDARGAFLEELDA